MSGSCVTISTVMPWSTLSARSSSMISRLRWVSRLPVGSSASSTAGSVTMARAIATRCCWPPESSAGVWCSQPARPTDCSALRGRGAPHGGALAAVEQRQLDVLLRRGARQQVEALEHEAEVAPAQPRALVARQRLDVRAVEQVLPGARRVQAAEDVHRGRLARAAGPHDGDELAGGDVEVDALQRQQLGLAAAVDLGHAAQADQRRRSFRRGRPSGR